LWAFKMEISRPTNATTATATSAFLTFLEKNHQSGLQHLLHHHHHHRPRHHHHHFQVLRRRSVVDSGGFISLENNHGPNSGSLEVAVVNASSRSFLANLTPRQKAVSRCLFGPPDAAHEQFAKQKMAEIKEQDKLKWGFDFDNEVPLQTKSQKWIWKKVPSLQRGNSRSEGSEESSEDTETEIDTEPEEVEPKSFLHSSSSSSERVVVPRSGDTLRRAYEDVNACVVVNVNSQDKYVTRGEQSPSSSDNVSPPSSPIPCKKRRLQKQSSILDYMPVRKHPFPSSPMQSRTTRKEVN